MESFPETNTRVRIACENPELLLPRLMTSVIRPADHIDDAYDVGHGYMPQAFKQHPPRRLNTTEQRFVQNHLIAGADTPAAYKLELLDCFDILHEIRRVGWLALREGMEAYFSGNLKDVLDGDYYCPKMPEFIAQVYSNPGVWNTSYVDPELAQYSPDMAEQAGKRPGIHVDNRFHYPLKDRADSPRRLGLNAGPGDRWLLFLVPDIITIAHAQGMDKDTVPRTRDLVDYVAKNPYRWLDCFWLRLRCGEAYIAPTEILFHDGSTYGARDPSTMIFWEWHHPSPPEGITSVFAPQTIAGDGSPKKLYVPRPQRY